MRAGDFPPTMSMTAMRTFIGNKRKIDSKKLPSFLNSFPLIAYAQWQEILVKAPSWADKVMIAHFLLSLLHSCNFASMKNGEKQAADLINQLFN